MINTQKELDAFIDSGSISLREQMVLTLKMTSTAVLPTRWIWWISTVLLSFFLSPDLKAQIYLASFSDKEANPYSIHAPEQFLSDRSVIRRFKQNIPIEESDLPVNPTYLQELSEVTSVSLIYSTKWLNAAVIRIDDSTKITDIMALDFVVDLSPLKNYYKKREFEFSKEEEIFDFNGEYQADPYYGFADDQNRMLKVDRLHEKGLKGEGMIIAVLDGGFNDFYQLSHFDSMRLEGRLLAQRDYVDLDHSSVEGSWHGMHVISCMAAEKSGLMTGTAPKASYILLRTEDVNSETPLEEINWVKAAEFADSLGADILNTSLGYTNYYLADGSKDSLLSYVPSDLDGNTSYITKGSDLAARKGMLVINSAGNSGNSSWKYLGMPADGDSVLAIGALDSAQNRIAFSSFGRSDDPRVKPNVMAKGFQCVLAHKSSDGRNTVRIGSGTSFSSPILAGAAACLWQARPEMSNMEIFDLIQQSADRFSNPDTAYGYGLPDFDQALELAIDEPIDYVPSRLYPNPFQDYFIYQFKADRIKNLKIEIFDLNGKLLFSEIINTLKGHNDLIIKPRIMREGLYLLKARSDSCIDQRLILKEIR